MQLATQVALAQFLAASRVRIFSEPSRLLAVQLATQVALAQF